MLLNSSVYGAQPDPRTYTISEFWDARVWVIPRVAQRDWCLCYGSERRLYTPQRLDEITQGHF